MYSTEYMIQNILQSDNAKYKTNKNFTAIVDKFWIT